MTIDNKTSKSYLVVAVDYKKIEETESRKKMRRIARKKYSKEYSSREYIIVSGDSLSDAIKRDRAERVAKEEQSTSAKTRVSKGKKKTVAVKTSKTKASKSKKTEKTTKLAEHMVDDLVLDEKKSAAKANKTNAKKQKQMGEVVFD